MIKYLVLSGGGPTGFLTYGVLRYLAKTEYWKLEDIKGIYGTSIGAIIGLIISLNYEWEELNDYLIKRPWNQIINQNSIDLTNIMTKKGIFESDIFVEILNPLLSAKDLDINITFQELYDFNQIDFHIYATSLNTDNLEKIDISHKTHPKLKIIDGIAMTAAYPFIFSPVKNDEDYYIDGGMLNVFPLNDCLEQTSCDENEILAIRNINKRNNNKINDNSSMIDLLIILLKKLQYNICSQEEQKKIQNIVYCDANKLYDFQKWIDVLYSEEERIQLINEGEQFAELYYNYINDVDKN